MEKALEQIKKIDKLDQCTISEALCKVLEELGEFTAEVNRTTGRKLSTIDNETIRANQLEECADTFQNLLLVMNRCGIGLEELEQEILRKDKKWFKKLYINGKATVEDYERIFGQKKPLTFKEILNSYNKTFEFSWTQSDGTSHDMGTFKVSSVKVEPDNVIKIVAKSTKDSTIKSFTLIPDTSNKNWQFDDIECVETTDGICSIIWI